MPEYLLANTSIDGLPHKYEQLKLAVRHHLKTHQNKINMQWHRLKQRKKVGN